MKITKVLKMCDTLFPNEFTEDEKLIWCNELGAIISREHSRHHRIVGVELAGGRYALPEGVQMSEVDRIVINNMLIKKSDAPECGIVLYSEDGRIFVCGDAANQNIKFLLRPGYEKIRKISLSGAKIIIEDGFVTIPVCSVKKGDKLQLEMGDNNYFVTVGDTKTNPDNTISFEVTQSSLPLGEFCGDIKRVITDDTVCLAPFDAMYCDFIGAKICFYQHDYDSYNHHMALFNSRLEDYDKYMIRNTPMLKDSRVTNWWH